MQAAEREGRVAHPGEAVVPVALAARRLGQRGRRRGDQRAGRRVGQALERQRAALAGGCASGGRGSRRRPASRASTRVVAVSAAVASSAVRGPSSRRDHESAQKRVSPFSMRWRARAQAALDAEVEVGHQPQRRAAVGGVEGVGVVRDSRPRRGHAAVVEHRLAEQLDLGVAVDAGDRPDEDVVGLVVGRRTRVGGRRALRALAPRADDERVADDDPARRRHPRRLQDHRARLVAAAGGDAHRRRAEAEAAGRAVEDRAEDAGGVKARRAEPLDRAVGRHERAGVAVAEVAVVGDRRERRSGPGCARRTGSCRGPRRSRGPSRRRAAESLRFPG